MPLARSFDCGVPALNEWLQRYAWQNHNSGGARVYVAIDRDDPSQISGYFCLSAADADYKSASSQVSRGLARHLIPVVLIGRLAVDQRYRGQNLGRFLVREAFRRIFEVEETIGVRAVMVVAKNDKAAEFYKKVGFESSVDDKALFFITLKDAKKSMEAATAKSRSG